MHTVSFCHDENRLGINDENHSFYTHIHVDEISHPIRDHIHKASHITCVYHIQGKKRNVIHRNHQDEAYYTHITRIVVHKRAWHKANHFTT